MRVALVSAALIAVRLAGAQYFPPSPKNVTKVNGLDGTYISFKEVSEIGAFHKTIALLISRPRPKYARRLQECALTLDTSICLLGRPMISGFTRIIP